MKNFYKRFRFFANMPFWRPYLKWAYKEAVEDTFKLGTGLEVNKEGFTCLLCGVSGEVTAEVFINFALAQNPKAKIIVIDLGEEQTNSVIDLVSKKYKDVDVTVKRANALNLTFMSNKSIDWIDTDGFLGFFDDAGLEKLLSEWKRILKDFGYITFREFAPYTPLGYLVDWLRKIITKFYINYFLNIRSRKQLEQAFTKHGFKFVSSWAPFPAFRRYCLKTSS